MDITEFVEKCEKSLLESISLLNTTQREINRRLHCLNSALLEVYRIKDEMQKDLDWKAITWNALDVN